MTLLWIIRTKHIINTFEFFNLCIKLRISKPEFVYLLSLCRFLTSYFKAKLIHAAFRRFLLRKKNSEKINTTLWSLVIFFSKFNLSSFQQNWQVWPLFKFEKALFWKKNQELGLYAAKLKYLRNVDLRISDISFQKNIQGFCSG